MIYFVEAVGLDQVKIGKTQYSAETRVAALKRECPFPLKLIKTVRGYTLAERFLHAKFDEHRLEGEWFRLSAIREAIEHLQEDDLASWDERDRPDRRPKEISQHEHTRKFFGISIDGMSRVARLTPAAIKAFERGQAGLVRSQIDMLEGLYAKLLEAKAVVGSGYLRGAP
jgi:hypothetical protein